MQPVWCDLTHHSHLDENPLCAPSAPTKKYEFSPYILHPYTISDINGNCLVGG